MLSKEERTRYHYAKREPKLLLIYVVDETGKISIRFYAVGVQSFSFGWVALWTPTEVNR